MQYQRSANASNRLPKRARAVRGLLLWLVVWAAGVCPALAQCDFPIWVAVWPSHEQTCIQPRQVLLLSTGRTGVAPALLRQIGRGFAPYLWSRHDSVPLALVDSLTNDNGTFQLLLQPVHALPPDSVFELRATRGGENVYYYFRNRSQLKGPDHRTIYRWRVARSADTVGPRWEATPQVDAQVYAPNSEGVDHYVRFTALLAEESPCLIRATVQHLPTGRQTRSYVWRWRDNRHVAVGTFTCNALFRLQPEAEYTVTFDAVDANGNRATCQPLLFKAPPFKALAPH